MSLQKEPRVTVAANGVIEPPDNREPEISFFPSGERPEQLRLLRAFPPHMDKILREPEIEKRRSFREYAITFALGNATGQTIPFNLRMRAFLQPLPDGRIEITNWQFTVKTKGNALSRQEFETADNLLSADLVGAFSVLKEKYGADLPLSVSAIDPNALYVDSVCLTARYGHNGLYRVFETQEASGSALVMVNSDDVVFVPPQIVNAQQEVIVAGYRPEAEMEVKDISRSDCVELWSKRADVNTVFDTTLHRLKQQALPLFGDKLTSYPTSKVDEAQKRVQSISGKWQQAASSVYMKPDFYTSPDMQEALRKLIAVVDSPYVEGHDQRVKRNGQMIAEMRAEGSTIRYGNGYTMALLRAS